MLQLAHFLEPALQLSFQGLTLLLQAEHLLGVLFKLKLLVLAQAIQLDNFIFRIINLCIGQFLAILQLLLKNLHLLQQRVILELKLLVLLLELVVYPHHLIVGFLQRFHLL